MKKLASPKKLVLSTVTVRDLQQNLSDAELKAVAGGRISKDPPGSMTNVMEAC